MAEAAKFNLKDAIDALLGKTASPNDCDLIFDIGTPNFVPIEGFAKAVEALIRRLPYLRNWRPIIEPSGFPFNPHRAGRHERY